MKKIYIFFVCCLIAILISGCEHKKITYVNSNYDETFRIIEVDSCEYLIGYRGKMGFLSHKGNCKYCKKRLENLYYGSRN